MEEESRSMVSSFLALRFFCSQAESRSATAAVNANGWATSSFFAPKQSPRSATVVVNANG